MPAKLYTYDEAGARLPVKKSAETIKSWCRKGLRGVRLETISVGGSVRIPAESLDRFLKEVASQRQK